MLMQYRDEVTGETEILWNSRDGVTPFIIQSRRGNKAVHVDWRFDVRAVNFKPAPGMRIFVDASPDQPHLIKAAQEYVEAHWDEGDYPMRLSLEGICTKEQAAAHFLAEWTKPGSPTVVEVPLAQTEHPLPSAEGWTPSAKTASILLAQEKRIAELEADLAESRRERDELRAKLNTPALHDFSAAVVLEAAHQRERWGSDHDAGKTPADWFWLLGYLGGKALHAHAGGNTDKALHHTISSAAALANWHAAISGESTAMRPGIDPDQSGITEAEQNQ